MSDTCIDSYTHVLPRPYLDALLDLVTQRGPLKRWLELEVLHDVEARLRVMSRFPGYRQVLTLSSPPIEAIARGADAARLARLANDSMAALCAAHPDELVAFVASLPMGEPDLAAEEATRAIGELGAVGTQIFTNVGGRPLDDERLRPVFYHLHGLDRPIWLHPARGPAASDYPVEDASRFEIWWALGWPYETTAAMARLAFSGLLDDLPGLRIVTHHMGGLAPFLEGRLALGWDQLGSRTPGDEYEQLLQRLERRPVEYFRDFYADTALFGSREATRLGVSFFGPERCLFASDFPFDDEQGAALVRETIAAIESLDLPGGDLEAIFSGNVEALMARTAAA